MRTMNLLETHDRLMKLRPEQANHPADCKFCSGEYASIALQGGNVSDITFTQEDVNALVADALAPLQAELDKLKTGQATAEVDAQIASVREEMEAQVAELQSKLDAAVLEAEAAKTENANVIAYLEAEAAQVVEAAERETRKAERVAKVAEVCSFPEDYVAERADKWASLSDEDFEALLADYKAIGEKSPKSPSGSGSGLPKQTAMVASREGAGGQTKVGSALLDLIQNRDDPRAIR